MSDNEQVAYAPSLDEQGQTRITPGRAESLPRRIATGPVLTTQGQYDIIEWSGVNLSGGRPPGDYILILPDQPSTKTTGGIELPDELIERMAYAAETGTIVAIGDGAYAWNADRTRPYQGEKPKPGTRVNFERYAGQLHHGWDGMIYRIITDKQIGLIEEGLPDGYERYFEKGKSHVRKIGTEPAQQKAMAEMGEIEPEAPSGWPKFTKRNGAIIMAFNEDDARLKAPDDLWWPTSAEADSAAAAAAALLKGA